MQYVKRFKFSILSILFVSIFYIILYKIYIPRINAFGCFDDCNNFMGGYFLLHGKRLFSEIFFNHNPLMAYVSFLVQYFANPQNLYELILRHRQALLLFSFAFNTLLVLRFGLPVFGFVIFYELTKFYLFGDRFLAEGFITYPFIYLVGLAVLKFHKKNINTLDYLFSAVFTWLIIFMREPYVPAALFLFGYLLWHKKFEQKKILSFILFFILSIATVFFHDLGEFFFNVVTVNVVLAASENNNILTILLKAFLYPTIIFFGGEWGYFRYILVALNSIFLFSSILLIRKKRLAFVLLGWIILGLLNFRFIEPGKAFYSAFHLLNWYGVFLFLSFVFVFEIYKYRKKLAYLLLLLYSVILLFHVFSPLSFLRSKPDPHYELIVNYGGPMQVGMVINSLSKPSDKLFVDGFDDIIYWQAQKVSTYKYSWYTSLMPKNKKYTDERINMFKTSPPEFYYGSCPKEQASEYLLPDFIKNEYTRLISDKKPSCLWVKKTKLSTISPKQWAQAESYNYFFSQK